MGLDVTAYSQLKREDEANGDDYRKDRCDIYQSSIEFAERHWPGRADGLKSGRYSFGDRLDFRAGSYSGYGEWRHWLARLVGWKDARDCWENGSPGSPFYELINFADNEGVLGSQVCAKLAKDFAHWQPKAEATTEDPDWNIPLFNKWKEACELAADGGAIDFH